MSKIKLEWNKEIEEKSKLLLKLDKNPVAIKIFDSLNEAEDILPIWW